MTFISLSDWHFKQNLLNGSKENLSDQVGFKQNLDQLISGQVKPGWCRVSPLYTSGQKYGRVESRPSFKSNLPHTILCALINPSFERIPGPFEHTEYFFCEHTDRQVKNHCQKFLTTFSCNMILFWLFNTMTKTSDQYSYYNWIHPYVFSFSVNPLSTEAHEHQIGNAFFHTNTRRKDSIDPEMTKAPPQMLSPYPWQKNCWAKKYFFLDHLIFHFNILKMIFNPLIFHLSRSYFNIFCFQP